jgi:hypothetical protein
VVPNTLVVVVLVVDAVLVFVVADELIVFMFLVVVDNDIEY